jgi:4-hydroxy-tetrahydrodipicolinate synthase
MGKSIELDRLQGVWSATPTPLNNHYQVDTDSVKRMVDHHVRLGVRGLFLAGSCGEGPWLPDREKKRLVETASKHSKDRLLVAVQVTDNSTPRILDNMKAAKDAGADIAVIAPPYFLLNATAENLLRLYTEAIKKSPLPVGIYDRGTYSSVLVPDEILDDIYRQENVVLVKDSSTNPKRREIALAARRKRSNLRLLDGDEFHCVEYLKAGYDGLLLGGGVFNGYLAGQIIKAVRSGDIARAEKLQERMNELMYAVYGGKDITCWLSGLKKLLVEMRIFSTWKNYLEYPLTDSCEREIKRVLKEDADVLLP